MPGLAEAQATSVDLRGAKTAPARSDLEFPGQQGGTRAILGVYRARQVDGEP